MRELSHDRDCERIRIEINDLYRTHMSQELTVDTIAYRQLPFAILYQLQNAKFTSLTFQDKSLNPYIILFTVAERIKF